MSRLHGIVPILPTPFDDRGAIDEPGFRRVIRYVLAAGAHGVAFPAMASEFYALTDDERLRLTEAMVDEVGGAVPVVGTATAASPQAALAMANAVEEAGVDAIMVMPPYVVREPMPAVTRLFERLASTVSTPLIVQNAPPPLGSAFSVDAVAQLLSAVPAIRYVKEEVMPGGQRIGRLLDAAPATLDGVFGGAGGRTIIDELERGAAGAMPACELTEVHVAIWNAHQAGDVALARDLYERSLPLLTIQAVFRMNMTKRVLHRRGLLASEHVRVGGTPLDANDRRELDVWLERIDDLLDASAASA
jgi:4-hydroxy-tetrahydrodipicolinate synthase